MELAKLMERREYEDARFLVFHTVATEAKNEIENFFRNN
jgi:hypothetical protein